METETYHMIQSCDQSIATWSEAGDNFIVKDPDKFAQVSTQHASLTCRPSK